jgi:hypothetical protein
MRAGLIKRLFYALPIHSQFVLLAFLTHQTDEVVKLVPSQWLLEIVGDVSGTMPVLRQAARSIMLLAGG